MITIFSGVPGSGKTSLVVDEIIKELKQGRKIFTYGIPDLVLGVHQAGNPLEWQDGTWLKIDRYDPELTKAKGIEGEWFPRGCPESCEWLSTCPRNGLERPDAGALIVVDEAHTHFPQRASGKAPPPYIGAFTVHRHQGLDFWIISQRPSFLDPFVRGLASRHVHLGLGLMSFTGKRVKYEWPEFQETLNRSSKMMAVRSDYKPSPAVFPLYKSATVHTKLDHRMPTILKMFFFAIGGLVFMAAMVVQRVQAHRADIEAHRNPAASTPAQTVAAPGSVPVPQSSVSATPGADDEFTRISGCVATLSFCRCFTNFGPADFDDAACRQQARAPVQLFARPAPADGGRNVNTSADGGAGEFYSEI